ncbi:MAG: exodeoxyribonuclease VII large subunit [Desulfobulbaceae bacterium]|nr:exodeoxyribonuclease VII large subunit [Desulfobulbaceae bacterium]
MLTSHSVKIQSVSELTSSIRGLLETTFPFVSVAGEISNLRRPQSGHYYFTLKDRDAQLHTVLFKQQQKYLTITPTDGLAVILRGRLSVYEARGEYQLLVDTLEARGTGDLQAEFELLKTTLASQGLFDQARKRPLPLLPRLVALVTSPKGAAVHDFIHMTRQRFPGFPLEIFPVVVQGDMAPDDIVEALELLNTRARAEVIVLCRGGGSLEDLRPFNTEKVARAIFASTIPVVSAIGHEIDFTISDFVADYRAATPTAAAEAVIPDRDRLQNRVNRAKQDMAASLLEEITTYQHQVSSQKRLLGDPSLLLSNFRFCLDKARLDLNSSQNVAIQTLQTKVTKSLATTLAYSPDKQVNSKLIWNTALRRRLDFAINMILGRKETGLREGALLLDAVSPLAVLGRGYSLTRLLPTLKVVSSAGEVEIGSRLEIILGEGSLQAKVVQTSAGTKRSPVTSEQTS